MIVLVVVVVVVDGFRYGSLSSYIFVQYDLSPDMSRTSLVLRAVTPVSHWGFFRLLPE